MTPIEERGGGVDSDLTPECAATAVTAVRGWLRTDTLTAAPAPASAKPANAASHNAKTQYLGTLSSIPELESQILRARNALAILIGRPARAHA
ncbi:hypothetical protein AWV80_41670 [Cupriavidus sp. UYMU48A]|nr:hypothetical protein AWV80_41670 [Cupriavidus sp. UYMU48A]